MMPALVFVYPFYTLFLSPCIHIVPVPLCRNESNQSIRSVTNRTIETGVFAHGKGVILYLNINIVTINSNNCYHTKEVLFLC